MLLTKKPSSETQETTAFKTIFGYRGAKGSPGYPGDADIAYRVLEAVLQECPDVADPYNKSSNARASNANLIS